jgi:hypothetical protein
MKIILIAALLLGLAACASQRDGANWGALSQQVGNQIGKAKP